LHIPEALFLVDHEEEKRKAAEKKRKKHTANRLPAHEHEPPSLGKLLLRKQKSKARM